MRCPTLLRRVLSSEQAAEALGMEAYEPDYPELFDPNYRVGVCEIAEKLVKSLETYGADYQVTLADNDAQRWLRGGLICAKSPCCFLASDATSRADLLNLRKA